jgi:hypothetical protein
VIDCTIRLRREDFTDVELADSRELRVRVEFIYVSGGDAIVYMNPEQASELLQQLGSTLEKFKVTK